MGKNKSLYPELVRNLLVAERRLSRALLFLSFELPSGVATNVVAALDDVHDALKYLRYYD